MILLNVQELNVRIKKMSVLKEAEVEANPALTQSYTSAQLKFIQTSLQGFPYKSTMKGKFWYVTVLRLFLDLWDKSTIGPPKWLTHPTHPSPTSPTKPTKPHIQMRHNYLIIGTIFRLTHAN